jgi:hypothetical protein
LDHGPQAAHGSGLPDQLSHVVGASEAFAQLFVFPPKEKRFLDARQAGEEFVHLEGFEQIIAGPRLHGFHRVFHRGEAVMRMTWSGANARESVSAVRPVSSPMRISERFAWQGCFLPGQRVRGVSAVRISHWTSSEADHPSSARSKARSIFDSSSTINRRKAGMVSG